MFFSCLIPDNGGVEFFSRQEPLFIPHQTAAVVFTRNNSIFLSFQTTDVYLFSPRQLLFLYFSPDNKRLYLSLIDG